MVTRPTPERLAEYRVLDKARVPEMREQARRDLPGLTQRLDLGDYWFWWMSEEPPFSVWVQDNDAEHRGRPLAECQDTAIAEFVCAARNLLLPEYERLRTDAERLRAALIEREAIASYRLNALVGDGYFPAWESLDEAKRDGLRDYARRKLRAEGVRAMPFAEMSHSEKVGYILATRDEEITFIGVRKRREKVLIEEVERLRAALVEERAAHLFTRASELLLWPSQATAQEQAEYRAQACAELAAEGLLPQE